MSSPKGWLTSKKVQSDIPGFTKEQTHSVAEFSTVQNTGSDRVALDITQRCAFTVSSGNVVATGTTKRIIKCIGLNARKGDIIKFTSGALVSMDAPVLSAPDADTIILGTELDAVPAVGVTFELCRYTFFKTDANGAIVATPGPTQYNRDGVTTFVSEDTTDVANRPMPMGLMIKDETGKWVPVVLDQTAPYVNRPVPVAITDISGASTVNVTASQLNMKITHNGVEPSSIRLGDGVTLAAITLNNELKTKDTDLLNELKTAHLELKDGGFSNAAIDNVTGVNLVRPTAGKKKISLAQNGGGDLDIYRGATKIGSLEKGGKIDFYQTFDGTEMLTLKNSLVGSITTNVRWNVHA